MQTREELLKRIFDNVRCPNPGCNVALGVACINSKRDVCGSRVREAKKQNIIGAGQD